MYVINTIINILVPISIYFQMDDIAFYVIIASFQ